MMEKISSMEVKKIRMLTESKEVEEIVDCLENFGLDIEKIGEGGNAEVYAVEGDGNFSRFCLKRIKDAPQIRNQDIDREHEYQMKVRKAGVTTPLTLVSFDAVKGSYLIMEKINGYSVKDISKNVELLPPNFDFKSFEFSLKEMIKKMHNAGIVHRDLNAGNIMINKEGKPVVIDFGTATEGTAYSEWVYQESVMLKNTQGNYEMATGYYSNDDERISTTILPMVRKAYFAQQGYVQKSDNL